MRLFKSILGIMLALILLFSEIRMPVYAGETTLNTLTQEVLENEAESELSEMDEEKVKEDTEIQTVDMIPVDEEPDSFLDGESFPNAVYNGVSSVAEQSESKLSLKIEYPSKIKCGEPATFTMNASGGSGTYKYRIHTLSIYDGSEWVAVYDVSYGSNGEYTDNNQFAFAFYASGVYRIRFSAMDMVTKETVNTGFYEHMITVQDENYPSVEEIVQNVSAKCLKECSTDFQKAKWLHDWIIDNAEYDRSYSYSSAEGVLARGEGTCESYHRAYVMLLNKVGIPTGRIVGNGHVWTAVKMDGAWYQVDTTWDDMGSSLKGTWYEHVYFGLTDEIIGLVHTDHKSAVSGYESTSLENNYFIKTGEITKWSDPFTSTIKQNIANGLSEFTLDVTDSMPDNYKNVIYNLVAYQLSKQNWDNAKIVVSYKDGLLRVKVIRSVSIIAEPENSQEILYSLKALHVEDTLGGVDGIQFAVWSEGGGQDDLVWYNGTKNAAGEWIAAADIRKHKTVGTYQVHAYAFLPNGGKQFLGAAAFNVAKPALTISTENFQINKGTYDVIINNVVSPSGIEKIQTAVWCAANQSDLKWYDAIRQDDGSYKVIVNVADHKYAFGNYKVHTYITAGNGVKSFGGETSQNVSAPVMEITAENTDGREINYTLKVTNAWALGVVRNIQFATWSDQNGQDDIRWYNGSRNSLGDYTAIADIRNHKTSGHYYVHVYAALSNGTKKYLGATTFDVTKPSLAVRTNNYQRNKGSFDVIIDHVNSPSGVNKIEAAVWCAANQSDLKWYSAEKQSDDSYKLTASMSNHNFQTGEYKIHLYLLAGNGIRSFGGAAPNQKVEMPVMDISAENTDRKETAYELKIKNAEAMGLIRNMQFAVWSESGGQDDIRWYNGSRNSLGEWVAAADIRNHRTSGLYNVHVYATLANSSKKYLGAATFTVTKPVLTVKTENYQEDKGTFDIIVDNIVSPSGVDNIRIPVWCAANQSDIKWYDAVEQGAGQYKASVNISNHDFLTGDYKVHTYITAGNGIYVFGGVTLSQTVKFPDMKISVEEQAGNKGTYTIKVKNTDILKTMRSVQFPVWSVVNGQDDIIWYNGVRNSEGEWMTTVNTSNHKGKGIYDVHIYGTVLNGGIKYLGAASFETK